MSTPTLIWGDDGDDAVDDGGDALGLDLPF